MRMPFSLAEFLGVFARYNLAVWPMQLVLYAAAALIVLLALRPGPRQSRAAGVLLAALWAWTGVVYHWIFFTRINPAAAAFGALFVAQAAVLLLVAVRGELRLHARADAPGLAGALLVAYALVAYPLLLSAAGHAWPAAPSFGAPCPLTIFTFGVLAWADARMPRWLLAIPAAWALIATTAAVSLTMTPDYALIPAAVIGTAAVLARRRGGERVTTPAMA
jgi:uncharacterized protein DUF6064